MIIHKIASNDSLWTSVADFAETCSWDACARMANFMREGKFNDWERIFTAEEDGVFIGFCALIKSQEFPGKEYGPLIKWLFVDEKYRGKRISQRLIEAAAEYAKNLGYDRVYLTTWHIGLYEKYGFKKVCDKEVRNGYFESVYEKKLNNIELIFPTINHKEAALEYRQEWLDCVPDEGINGSWGFQRKEYKDYEKWLNDIEGLLTGQSNNPNINVPSTTYFAFCENIIVGNIQIRHYLNDYLLNTYGHIGYGVRPSERRKGYATQMLALALEKCRGLGIEKVLISCDKNNIGSVKTITKNSGILEKEFAENDGNIVQQYWITL